ncbi:MAG: hypothetical protein PUE31_06595 [Eubacterium pyruvativorans]|uniref:hypothetical protein n=1 Tax=Eubacterium pyruvativorans TaxID=155865 RepID=UPI00240A2DFF|nr:hypothetical protein [Eubacterium pyruvativorans]MDD6708176.1 hypothetical protein [Eubacterium pyruvativorans]
MKARMNLDHYITKRGVELENMSVDKLKCFLGLCRKGRIVIDRTHQNPDSKELRAFSDPLFRLKDLEEGWMRLNPLNSGRPDTEQVTDIVHDLQEYMDGECTLFFQGEIE